MPEVGDVVIYKVGQKSYNALVVGENISLASHLGKDGEPLLHLAFVAPDRESESARKKIGYVPQVFTVFDVVHESQEFSPQFKAGNGISTPAQLAQQRGEGEWAEPVSPEDPGLPTAADLDNYVADHQVQGDEPCD